MPFVTFSVLIGCDGRKIEVWVDKVKRLACIRRYRLHQPADGEDVSETATTSNGHPQNTFTPLFLDMAIMTNLEAQISHIRDFIEERFAGEAVEIMQCLARDWYLAMDKDAACVEIRKFWQEYSKDACGLVWKRHTQGIQLKMDEIVKLLDMMGVIAYHMGFVVHSNYDMRVYRATVRDHSDAQLPESDEYDDEDEAVNQPQSSASSLKRKAEPVLHSEEEEEEEGEEDGDEEATLQEACKVAILPLQKRAGNDKQQLSSAFSNITRRVTEEVTDGELFITGIEPATPEGRARATARAAAAAPSPPFTPGGPRETTAHVAGGAVAVSDVKLPKKKRAKTNRANRQ